MRYRNISFQDEQGSSLIAVLVVVTILSLLIGSVMLGMIMQNRFIQRDADRLQARYTAEAGIYHFLSDTTYSYSSSIDSLTISLLDSSQSAVLKVRPFGGFLAVTSTAKGGGQSKTIQTLVGQKASKAFGHAIVLGDLRSALTITGRTSIEGDIMAGPMGLKKRPFKGERFEGSVKGRIMETNEAPLPQFDKTLFDLEISYCEQLLAKAPQGAVRLNSGTINLSRRPSIFEKGKAYFVEGDLELGNTSGQSVPLPESLTLVVTGKLGVNGSLEYGSFSRFVAGEKLVVSGNISGKNGLFYAGRELEVSTEGQVSGQFISKEQLLVQGNSYLRYPSVIYSEGKVEKGIRKGRIEISGGSVVEGTVMIAAPEKMINEDESRLVIGQGATVRGGIYNTSQTELHGEVDGSILTLQFYFYHSPTSYINWLKDASVSLPDRPDRYAVPLGFSNNEHFDILAWKEL